ncbi:MAG: YicC family protein [Dethiosulfovibrio peptidovorans]|nr:MAG: YicC family protein [Dethiosulfovibrio peptidovorans]
MLTSMTGFSRVSKDQDWGTLTIELSSVNSRYLEIFVKTGRELSSEEPLIQRAIRKRLSRGKVQVRVDLAWTSEARMGCINTETLRGYVRQVQDAAVPGVQEPIAIDGFLSLPGVVESPLSGATLQERVSPVVMPLLDRGLDELIAMRETEGEALMSHISGLLDNYSVVLRQIGDKWRDGADAAFEGLRDRVQAAAERYACSLDEGRLAQELTVIADKWDISEEISRTESHLRQFVNLLNGGGSRGRKLDFLLQEMNREINTMGSKVADAYVRWLVVEGKTILERIREQVQNVE